MTAIAALSTPVLLYLIGLLASFVLGKKLIAILENRVGRLPLADVVMTDWTLEEAMSFVMTGGTNAPDHVRFSNPPRAAAQAQPE